MKYFDEAKMHDVRIKLEKSILSWENVTTRKMFGCPCYKTKDKLFAFIVTGGVVLTALKEDDRNALSKKFNTSPFVAGKKIVLKWVTIPVKNSHDIKKVLPYIKKSYQQIYTTAE
jgi:predicted DNA-binding protein (MmcQ/YjbR family)